MTNAYVTLDTLKGTGALNIVGTAYDERLRSLIEHVSRQEDRVTNRAFFSKTETKTFDGDGSTELLVPDLIAITTLKEDSNNDGTLNTTWAAADFLLEPHNAAPTADGDWSRPYTSLRVSPFSTGNQDVFLRGIKNYEIIGTWGFRSITGTIGFNGTLADASDTSMLTTGTALEVGQTVVIESEQVYVTAFVPSAGTGTATVERRVNGSTGTAHDNKALSIVKYPGEVEEACFIMVARLWKRKDSAFSSEIGFPETGQMVVFRGGLDPDVKDLLGPYTKPALGLGI